MTAVMESPTASASSRITAAADSARYALRRRARKLPPPRTCQRRRLPPPSSRPRRGARHGARERGDAEELTHEISRASAPLVDWVMGSSDDLSSLRPSGRDTSGISLKAAVSARAKPWRAPERPEPRPRASRLSAYTNTGEQPVSVGPSPLPSPASFIPAPAKPTPRRRRQHPHRSSRRRRRSPRLVRILRALSSFTRLTADFRRTSASTFARSQKCCSTCPGTSSRTTFAARLTAPQRA